MTGIILAGGDSTEPGCACRKCWSERNKKRKTPRFFPFIVCSHCGNKRCPHATDHNLECTDSNEPGQNGSDYLYRS